MQALVWITAILVIIGMAGPGIMKLTGNQMAVEMAEKLDYLNLMKPIGVAEVAAAVGVLLGAIGGDLEWLGLIAALGVIALMVGAALYHRRGGDSMQETLPSIVILIVAAIYIFALTQRA